MTAAPQSTLLAAVEALEKLLASLPLANDGYYNCSQQVKYSDVEACRNGREALSLLRAALEAREVKPWNVDDLMQLVFRYGAERCNVDRSNSAANNRACNDAIDAIRSYLRGLAASPVAAPVEARPVATLSVVPDHWPRATMLPLGMELPPGTYPLYASPVAADTQGDAPQAARDVLAERKRQVSAEGWTPEHDDEHTSGCMAAGAACYALLAASQAGNNEYWNRRFRDEARQLWQWDREWFKPKDARSNLVRAAALALAEIERIDRAAMKEQPSSVSPLGPGEDEYLSWVKELERGRVEGAKEQPSDGVEAVAASVEARRAATGRLGAQVFTDDEVDTFYDKWEFAEEDPGRGEFCSLVREVEHRVIQRLAAGVSVPHDQMPPPSTSDAESPARGGRQG